MTIQLINFSTTQNFDSGQSEISLIIPETFSNQYCNFYAGFQFTYEQEVKVWINADNI